MHSDGMSDDDDDDHREWCQVIMTAFADYMRSQSVS